MRAKLAEDAVDELIALVEQERAEKRELLHGAKDNVLELGERLERLRQKVRGRMNSTLSAIESYRSGLSGIENLRGAQLGLESFLAELEPNHD